jgi:uncharacterized protein YutE (UPF0331/DUF86 family)
MVDEARLRDLLDRLAAAREELRRLEGMGRDAVRGDVDRLNSVKYLFVVAAEICIDIGNHVIASESLRAPSSYADVFTVLAEAAWLHEGLASRLADMARFRNLLVHGYADVDDDRVMDVLHSSPTDLEAYAGVIAGAVGQPSGP